MLGDLSERLVEKEMAVYNKPGRAVLPAGFVMFKSSLF
jgi:hypothetical protein